MGGRHQNYEDPITWARDIRKTKFDLLGFFWATLYITCYILAMHLLCINPEAIILNTHLIIFSFFKLNISEWLIIQH